MAKKVTYKKMVEFHSKVLLPDQTINNWFDY
uniref:Uncharacterized protein n=1 Tax=Anguilla anguilla TaxID=7936 RepID=A0A0E9VAN7_ANGAN